MKIAPGTLLIAFFLLAEPALACLRPTIDERAVQWSTSIVIAKLNSIDAPVQLDGSVKERRGNLGILGTAETFYFSRVYHFTVTQVLDGTATVGEAVSVLRVTSRTEEPQLNCGQHLTPKSVNGSFLLLLRPFSTFTQALPNPITPPKDPSLQCIIHMEELASLKPDDLKAVQNTIESTHAAESQFNQKTADRLLAKIAYTANNLVASPSIRAFEKFGLKGLAALDTAMGREPLGSPAYSRLQVVRSDLMPPTSLISMIGSEPAEAADAPNRRR